MKTEKSQSEGERIMLEFPALSVDPRAEVSREFRPEGERIIPATRFTEFPALTVDPRVGMSRSVSKTNI